MYGICAGSIHLESMRENSGRSVVTPDDRRRSIIVEVDDRQNLESPDILLESADYDARLFPEAVGDARRSLISAPPKAVTGATVSCFNYLAG
jgi:hypothetical protein